MFAKRKSACPINEIKLSQNLLNISGTAELKKSKIRQILLTD